MSTKRKRDDTMAEIEQLENDVRIKTAELDQMKQRLESLKGHAALKVAKGLQFREVFVVNTGL